MFEAVRSESGRKMTRLKMDLLWLLQMTADPTKLGWLALARWDGILLAARQQRKDRDKA